MFKKLELKDYYKILAIVLILAISIITSKYIGILTIISKLIKSLFPVLLAIAISFINEPLILKLNKKINRKISVIIIYILEVLLTSLIFILIIPSLIDQLKKFFIEIPELYNSIMD